MGTRECVRSDDTYSEATAMELWGAGELGDCTSEDSAVGTCAAVVGGLVALAAFFVAFAPLG